MSLSEKRNKLKGNCESSVVIPSKHIREVVAMVLKEIEKQDKQFIQDILEAIPYKKTAWAKLMRLEIIDKAGKELAGNLAK